MSPAVQALKVPASKLPFNPFVPRIAWEIKKSLFAEMVLPAMTQLAPAMSRAFAVSTQNPLIAAPMRPHVYLSGKKEVESVAQPLSEEKVALKNFSVVMRAVPNEHESIKIHEKVFSAADLDKESKQILPRKTLSKKDVPVVHFVLADAGNSLLFGAEVLPQNDTLVRAMSGPIMENADHGELALSLNSWFRVTRRMAIFSVLDGFYRLLAQNIPELVLTAPQAYEMAIIVKESHAITEVEPVVLKPASPVEVDLTQINTMLNSIQLNNMVASIHLDHLLREAPVKKNVSTETDRSLVKKSKMPFARSTRVEISDVTYTKLLIQMLFLSITLYLSLLSFDHGRTFRLPPS